MKKIYLTIAMIEAMNGDYSKIKMETTYIAHHDGNRTSTDSTKLDLKRRGFQIKEYLDPTRKVDTKTGKVTKSKEKFYMLSWDTMEGNPEISLKSKDTPIKRITEISDEDFEYSLFILKK